MRNYYDIRICYDERPKNLGGTSPFQDIRHELLYGGKLRQGWSPAGATLRNGKFAYRDAWIKNGWDPAAAFDRYKILEPMLSIRDGDIILVPKVSLVLFSKKNRGNRLLSIVPIFFLS